MTTSPIPPVGSSVTIAKRALQQLFDNLRGSGFRLIGPTRGGNGDALVLEEISRIEDLPVGWTDEQQPAHYRLKKARGTQYFGYNLGPQSWKQFLHPPRLKLFSVAKNNGKWRLEPAQDSDVRYAFIGVRACELHAIAIQDRVFQSEEFRDPHYSRRRERSFILAVNCGQAASTCFCTSMKTGPRATSGFDLALTELHAVFVVEIGSEAGSQMLQATGWVRATSHDLRRVRQHLEHTESQIERKLRTDDLPELLHENLEHPRWEAVATRCLACANCTMVCPTCFCTTVEDTANLRGTHAERIRVWDSCFNLDFSHVHGGNIRPTTMSRYRQWLTHKLASWIGQFGTSGCVGCGRCITWCPVGIDLTEEVRAIREAVAK